MAEQKNDKTKPAFVISDIKDTNFNDTDVEHRFTAGTIVELPEGVFGNYEHAGLVRSPTAEDKKAASAAK